MTTPRFTPLQHQRPVLDYLMKGGRWAVLVWHRRSGKDLTLWNYMWAAAQKRVGLYFYFYPEYAQAKKAVWYGMDEDGVRFLDYIPTELVDKTHDTDMRIHFKNGSIMQLIGSDNIDSIMSTNPVGCVFSEYALQDPKGWRYTSPILIKNGGWAAFPYTPRGHNHGYDLFKNTEGLDGWFNERLTIEDTGLINPRDLDVLRATGIPEEEIQQEYYCSFDMTNSGAYFGQQMLEAERQGRIQQNLYNPMELVHTAWDFGVNDSTVIWFVQTDGRHVWAIDCLDKANNKGLPEFAWELQERHYVYGTHLAPHDVMKREFGTGDQIMQAGAKLGIHFTLVPRTAKRDQVSAAHFLLPRVIFDEIECQRGIEGLKAYERGWDQVAKTHKNTANHNWASHIADAFMVLAVGIDYILNDPDTQAASHGSFNPRNYESYAAFDPRKPASTPRNEPVEPDYEPYGVIRGGGR